MSIIETKDRVHEKELLNRILANLSWIEQNRAVFETNTSGEPKMFRVARQIRHGVVECQTAADTLYQLLEESPLDKSHSTITFTQPEIAETNGINAFLLDQLKILQHSLPHNSPFDKRIDYVFNKVKEMRKDGKQKSVCVVCWCSTDTFYDYDTCKDLVALSISGSAVSRKLCESCFKKYEHTAKPETQLTADGMVDAEKPSETAVSANEIRVTTNVGEVHLAEWGSLDTILERYKAYMRTVEAIKQYIKRNRLENDIDIKSLLTIIELELTDEATRS